MSESLTARARATARPAGVSRRRIRRVRHHAALALGSALSIVLLLAVVSGGAAFRLSLATAYTALVLLGVTLFLGPANVLLRRPNPVSTDLRRDIGIWATLIGLLHTVVGLQVHFAGRMWLYFIKPLEERGRFPFRLEPFGFANYTGLLAAALLVFLLALSNDLSLRKLGRGRWKALQRLNYALFALVVLHALLYQTIERRPWPYVSSGLMLIVGILGVQLFAAWLVFRHRRVVGR